MYNPERKACTNNSFSALEENMKHNISICKFDEIEIVAVLIHKKYNEYNERINMKIQINIKHMIT